MLDAMSSKSRRRGGRHVVVKAGSGSDTYSVRAVLYTLEMDHTIKTGKGSSVTTIAVRVEFLLC